MKVRFMLAFALGTAVLFTSAVRADDYVIDTKGAHAFIQFRIKHLGYSWLLGRFNRFSGTFSFDQSDPNKARVQVVIDTASVDSNHAERDKHLRGEDFLDVKRHPEARFVSTSFEDRGDGTALLQGDLTLNGVTRPVTIDVQHVGNGPDPWGGYRRGFEGKTSLVLADFGIDYDLGPAAKSVDLFLSVEGIRQ
jgi:polyisoprenoid-binding protein YceI